MAIELVLIARFDELGDIATVNQCRRNNSDKVGICVTVFDLMADVTQRSTVLPYGGH